MKDCFINYNVKKYQQTNPSESDVKIYKYGLETTYSLVTKTFVTLLVALILNVFFEALYLLIFYFFIRLFAFGIHANNNITCWIVTLSTYIIIPLLIKYIIIPIWLYYILYALFSLFIFIFAPADTPKRPLIRKKKRTRNKIFASIIVLIYFLLTLYFKNPIILKSILFAIIIEGICVNPLTYKIFKVQFNNYKYFKKIMV